jgi:hypothetical protein
MAWSWINVNPVARGVVRPVFAAAACVLAVAGAATAIAHRPGAAPAAGTPVGPLPSPAAPVPLRVGPTLDLAGPLDGARIVEAVERVPTAGLPRSLSLSLHVMRLFGAEVTQGDPKTGAPVPGLDHRVNKVFFPENPSLVQTREGVRCRVAERQNAARQPEREAHVDQLLAVLAEAGVPLTRPLSTARGASTVGALLDDSLANFDLKAGEIEWSALAFALYLPPRTSWADKYGRVTTFDQLAGEMMRRPVDEKTSCGGTHLLYSLTILLRADQQRPVLSPPTREAVRAFLAAKVKGLAASQRAAGYWTLDWYLHDGGSSDGTSAGDPHEPALEPDPKSANEVLVTGHHLEWMMLLPADLRPPDACFIRGAGWLLGRLASDPLPMLVEHYCPYSHAALVLWALSHPSSRFPRPAASRPAPSSGPAGPPSDPARLFPEAATPPARGA